MASLPTITKYLALFHELYPTRDVTALTAEAWEYALSDMSDVTFGWAADRILGEPERQFFPTPNELRRHVRTEGRAYDGPTRITSGDVAIAHADLSDEQKAEWQRVKDSLRHP